MEVQEIMRTSWSDEEWRAELQKLDNTELLLLWYQTTRSQPPIHYGESVHKWQDENRRHALHCMLGEILERMGE